MVLLHKQRSMKTELLPTVADVERLMNCCAVRRMSFCVVSLCVIR
jgi:hypothetical protein